MNWKRSNVFFPYPLNAVRASMARGDHLPLGRPFPYLLPYYINKMAYHSFFTLFEEKIIGRLESLHSTVRIFVTDPRNTYRVPRQTTVTCSSHRFEVTEGLEPLQMKGGVASLSVFYRSYHAECAEKFFFILSSPFHNRTNCTGLRYHDRTAYLPLLQTKSFGD